MALSEEKIRFYVRRLMLSRMRILCTNGFYGLLLMHMIYSIDEKCETACTDGERIYFGPAFLDDLSDRELDFVMMHEIMHVVLQHCRRQGKRNQELFNIACDIVVNSNILLSNEMDLRSITLQKYGESMHYAPNGKEGHEYTAEEVYAMLLNSKRYNPVIAPLRRMRSLMVPEMDRGTQTVKEKPAVKARNPVKGMAKAKVLTDE